MRKKLARLWPAHPMRDRARNRVKKLPTQDLLDAADNTGSTVAAALYRHRKQPDTAALHEAADGVMVLTAIVEELLERSDA